METQDTEKTLRDFIEKINQLSLSMAEAARVIAEMLTPICSDYLFFREMRQRDKLRACLERKGISARWSCWIAERYPRFVLERLNFRGEKEIDNANSA